MAASNRGIIHWERQGRQACAKTWGSMTGHLMSPARAEVSCKRCLSQIAALEKCEARRATK